MYPLRDDLLNEVTARLKRDYGLKEEGQYLRKGRCPECKAKDSLFTPASHPWVLRCGRIEKCAWEGETKKIYPEIFDDWSKQAVDILPHLLVLDLDAESTKPVSAAKQAQSAKAVR